VQKGSNQLEELEESDPNYSHRGLQDMGRPKPRKPQLLKGDPAIHYPLNKSPRTPSPHLPQLPAASRTEGVLRKLLSTEKKCTVSLQNCPPNASELEDHKETAVGHEEMREGPEADL
jgi:hypothetical protein